MAKKVKRKSIKTQKKVHTSPFNIYWTKSNYYLLLVGVLVIIAGFYFMSVKPWDSSASLVISPILLVIGYVLIFPASILYKKKKQAEENTSEVKEEK